VLKAQCLEEGHGFRQIGDGQCEKDLIDHV
jgi:hypothetical protein